MIEEFQMASSLLNTALERYLAACANIADCYNSTCALKGISQAILDLIPGEIATISSRETKFAQANAILNRIRNIIPTITPISILPPDILTYIFQLVFKAQPGYFEDQTDLISFPIKYPEVLSHVCSRWRQIALSSRTLWSRVEVIPSRYPDDMLSTRLLARAEAYVTRAHSSPLDIYISNQASVSPIDIRLNAFCASVAARARSLNLLGGYRSGDPNFSSIETFFANCRPGTLNEIVIKGDSRLVSSIVIEASEARADPNSRPLDILHTHLEECLLPVSVLRLTGVYFHWTSQAYHGLVELHLGRWHITESQLRGILGVSPRLRVLHLGLDILPDLLPHGAQHAAIGLDDLEVLNLSQMNSLYYEIMPRILASDSKALHLSVNCAFLRFPTLYDDRSGRSIARTSITKLYIDAKDFSGYPHPHQVFEVFRLLHTPNLRVLSLANFGVKSDPTTTSLLRAEARTWDESYPPAVSQLDLLHLIQCHVDLDDLRRVAEAVWIQKLKISGGSILNKGGVDGQRSLRDEQTITGLAPIVEFFPAPGEPSEDSSGGEWE